MKYIPLLISLIIIVSDQRTKRESRRIRRILEETETETTTTTETETETETVVVAPVVIIYGKSWSNAYPDPIITGATCPIMSCNDINKEDFLCKIIKADSVTVYGDEECNAAGDNYECLQNVDLSSATETHYKCLQRGTNKKDNKLLAKEEEPCVSNYDCQEGMRCKIPTQSSFGYWGKCSKDLLGDFDNCQLSTDCNYGFGCHDIDGIKKCSRWLALLGGAKAYDERFCSSMALNTSTQECLDTNMTLHLQGANETGILECSSAVDCKYLYLGKDLTYTADDPTVCICPSGDSTGKKYCKHGRGHPLMVEKLTDVGVGFGFIYIYRHGIK